MRPAIPPVGEQATSVGRSSLLVGVEAAPLCRPPLVPPPPLAGMVCEGGYNPTLWTGPARAALLRGPTAALVGRPIDGWLARDSRVARSVLSPGA